MRIGLFAKVDIDAQSEVRQYITINFAWYKYYVVVSGFSLHVSIISLQKLFFDYRYDDTIDNDLIIKPAHKFHWMKSSPTHKNSKKKIPPTNNILTKAAKKNALF